MMTRLAAALTLATIASGVSTPARASAQLSGGVRADVALASFQKADYRTDPRLGVRAGVYGDLGLMGPIGIRAEAVYAMKGVQNADASSNIVVKLDYLEVPVMAKVALRSGTGLFLLAGPFVGVKLSSKLTSDAGSSDYGDLVRPLDFGLVGGAGFDASMGGRRVTFDVRYTWGGRAVFDFGDPGDTDSDDKNQVVSAGVGVVLF